MKVTERCVFFYSGKDIFSNHYRCGGYERARNDFND